jgi:hypothetical protein
MSTAVFICWKRKSNIKTVNQVRFEEAESYFIVQMTTA